MEIPLEFALKNLNSWNKSQIDHFAFAYCALAARSRKIEAKYPSRKEAHKW